MWLVVVALGAGAVLWMTGDDQRPTRRHVSPASAPRIAQTPTPGIAPETRTDDPTPDVMALPAAPDTVDPSSTATPDTSPRPSEGEPEATAPRPAPRLSPRNDVRSPSDGWSGPKNPRAPPPGTPEAHAEALRRLPVGRADRPPVAGVGPMGLHVDRVAIGSMYDAGKCAGHETGFSATRHDRVSVCFRVVHPRTTQRVTVLWQRDGETMRRTKMTIPSAHAYRTRAFIVLREGDAGRWNVRIMSTDGIELARAGFDVAA